MTQFVKRCIYKMSKGSFDFSVMRLCYFGDTHDVLDEDMVMFIRDLQVIVLNDLYDRPLFEPRHENEGLIDVPVMEENLAIMAKARVDEFFHSRRISPARFRTVRTDVLITLTHDIASRGHIDPTLPERIVEGFQTIPGIHWEAFIEARRNEIH